MEPLSRVTPATVDILSSLLDAGESTWGLLVIRNSGRPAGTVYPVLERLERLGWVESTWEDDPERSGPRRRLYTLTGAGADAARTTVRTFRSPRGSTEAATA